MKCVFQRIRNGGNMSSSRKIAKIEGYEDEDMKNIIKCIEKQGSLVSEYDELDDDYKIWNILK